MNTDKHKPEQDKVAKVIWDFWKSKGVSDELAASWVGNAEGETSLYPEQRGDAGKGLGISQWHWEPRGKAILEKTGIDVRKVNVLDQCNAIFWEIHNGLGYRNVAAKLAATHTIEEAISIIVNSYEQSANREQDVKKRTEFAKHWFNKFGVKK